MISYESYGEILFQKVALRYLLHFVQDGSSKNANSSAKMPTIENWGNIMINPPSLSLEGPYLPLRGALFAPSAIRPLTPIGAGIYIRGPHIMHSRARYFEGVCVTAVILAPGACGGVRAAGLANLLGPACLVAV